MQLETVKVVSPVSDDNPNGYIVINKSDFNEEEHELFDTEADPKTHKAPKAKAPKQD